MQWRRQPRSRQNQAFSWLWLAAEYAPVRTRLVFLERSGYRMRGLSFSMLATYHHIRTGGANLQQPIGNPLFMRYAVDTKKRTWVL
jgi:hypothetical protein